MVRFALQISELYLCIRRTFRKSEWRTKKSERIGLSDEESLIDLSSSGESDFFSTISSGCCCLKSSSNAHVR